MFPTSIAGSLPKPAWLAETHKLWPQWKAEGDELGRPRPTPRCCGSRRRKTRAWTIVGDGEQSRQHFVHGFLEQVEGIDFEHKVKMGIRDNRYDAMVPQVVGPCGSRAGSMPSRRNCRAPTPTRKLKFTLPGPMTIVDTVADRFYGDKVKMAFAFAELLNQEALALAGRRRGHHPVRRAGLQRLHEGGGGLGREGAGARGAGPDLHDRRPHLLWLRHQGQRGLEDDAGRGMAPVRADLPGAGREQHRAGEPGVLSTRMCRPI